MKAHDIPILEGGIKDILTNYVIINNPTLRKATQAEAKIVLDPQGRPTVNLTVTTFWPQETLAEEKKGTTIVQSWGESSVADQVSGKIKNMFADYGEKEPKISIAESAKAYESGSFKKNALSGSGQER